MANLQDVPASQSLDEIASKVAEAARQHRFRSKAAEAFIDPAAMLQLQSLFQASDDLERIAELESIFPRIADLGVVLAALLNSESAWQTLLTELEQLKPYANKKYGAKLGTLVNDLIDDTVSHLSNEAGSRDHLPNFRSRLGSFSGRASLRTWLRTVALNRVVSELRRGNPDETIGAACDLDGAKERELDEAIRMAIEELPPSDQLFARLVFIFEESQVDIAELLGVTPAAVSQRKKRILDKMREILVNDARPPGAGE